MRIHNVFHVSLLAQYHATGTVQPPPAMLADEGLYEIHRILRHREVRRGRRVLKEYLVSWSGCGPEHNSWEPETHLPAEPVAEYWDDLSSRQLARAKCSASGAPLLAQPPQRSARLNSSMSAQPHAA